jgi:AmmeMemoRadiSam system protein B
VQLHWGIEGAAEPEGAQRMAAARLALAGADLVVGHHPHVVQPVAWLTGAQGRRALVAYSLGNLLFDATTAETRRGALLFTEIDEDGVVGYRVAPVVTDHRGARPAPPADAAAVAARMTGRPRAERRTPGAEPSGAHAALHDPAAFARAAARTRARPLPAADLAGARLLTVPHHWLAGELILRPLCALGAAQRPRRVVLLAPNHRNAGSAAVLGSPWAWQTPFGELPVDADALAALVRDRLAREAPEVLAGEHAVSGLAAAVRYCLPAARLLPLAVRDDLRGAEVRALGTRLARLLGPGTALVVSVDFSHGLSAPEAARRDRVTLATLERLDAERVRTFGNEHLDAPGALAIGIEAARLAGARRFRLLDHRDASDFGAPPAGPVTSYIVGVLE